MSLKWELLLLAVAISAILLFEVGCAALEKPQPVQFVAYKSYAQYQAFTEANQ